MVRKLFKKFTILDLIILAFMAGIGIAVKPLAATVAHLLTGPLMIPGGSFAGGLYMMFIVLGAALVGKTGSATLIALVQALLVIVTGIYGSHGVASLFTYVLPGVLVDVLWLIMRHNGCCMLCCFFGSIIANVTGAFLVDAVFMRLPVIPLLLSLFVAAISGGVGGVIAWKLATPLKKVLKM